MFTIKLKNQRLKEENAKGGDNYIIMKTIDRNKLIAEELIRDHIKKRIQETLTVRRSQEYKFRNIVRRLLEAETGTEEPSEYTGINVLASLLEKIVPVLEDDYKMLTTSDEQRESFRNHIVHAIKNSLRPIEQANTAESLPESFEFEIDADILSEKIKLDLTPEDADEDSIEGEFIDIEGDEEDSGFGIGLDDQNETGRNFAAVTYKKIEKQIVDAYDMLADDKDQQMFYDYLLTNILLYFDKFEDELQPSLPDTTTPEYEQEKDEEDSEGEEEAATEIEDVGEEEEIAI